MIRWDAGLGRRTRGGLLVAALGGIVAAFAPAGAIVEGPSAVGSGEVTQEVGVAITVIALLLGALLVGAAAAPRLGAHYAGIAVAAGLAAFLLFPVVAARNSDDFASGASLTLGWGGQLLVAGSVIAIAGVVLALVGVRDAPTGSAAANGGGTSGKAVAALVLGVASFLLGTVTAALAIAFATTAALDIRASDGRLGGRGLAVGGLVCGIVFLVLWYLGFLALALFAEPSD